MKTSLTYNEAFSKLEKLVEKLEDTKISLDKLPATIKEAEYLITICENKLRNIKIDIQSSSKNLAKKRK